MIARIPWPRAETLTGIKLYLQARPHPVVVVFSIYVGFSVLFGLLIPAVITSVYDIHLVPQDYYQMPAPGGDFVATYAAANRVLRGEPIYDTTAYDEASTDPYGRLYSYPPLHVYAFVPLALLPYKISYLVWNGLTVVLIMGSCLLAARLTEAPALVFVSLLLIYTQSSFLQFQLERGQTDAPSLFLMVAMISAYAGKRRNIYLAALWLALAALIKALPAAFVLFFLLRREFRLLLAFAAIGIALALLTGISNWTTWATQIAPTYSTYFLGYNVDHSLYYLFEGFTRDLPSALTLARGTAALLLAAYTVLIVLSRQRQRLLLIELGLFVTLIEIATPWSANYKLVVLLFLFLSPFAILQIPFVRRQPVRFVVPLFVAFVLIVPWYGEYLTRLPYSMFAELVPARIVIANPLNPFISDRKVIVGLLGCVVYLFGLYAISALPLGPAFARLGDRLHASGTRSQAWRRVLPLAGLGLASVAIGALWWGYQRDQTTVAALISQFGTELPINKSVGISGYQVHYDSSTHYTVTIVYHVHAPIRENLQVYLHANTLDSSGKITSTIGRNFFPGVITSFWPTDKYIVAVTDSFFEPKPYTLNIGFFDLSDGRQYGEASLGQVMFPTS